ncbi:MAG: phosphate acyltransferase PlsX [Acidimicrobiales bacterium]|nr:phosphate acyltransferase PlsX [Acidimicrobiales bacterium]
MLPIAVDAMGGDHAPDQIVAGARQAQEEDGIPVVLVGRSDQIRDPGPLEVIEASEVIPMDADPSGSVRRMKDSSLVRAAEAVRDGKASAMVSAGNTGATMASALLRMGRIRGVARPAIATPIPDPVGAPCVLLDAGANSECQPEWLVQFALMGAIYSRDRYGVECPKVGLLSIGEEPTKGNALVKDAHKLLVDIDWDALGAQFIGNIEGRDLMASVADVCVTDGFTGNVTLKSLEGGMRALIGALLGVFDSSDEARDAASTLMPALSPLYAQLDPENTGGALMLGVDGVCIISHGSSSALAMRNAVGTAAEMVQAGLVESIRTAVARS